MIDANEVARLREQHAAATAGELVKASSEYYDHCLYISGELVPFACFERIEDLWLHRAAHNALPDVLDALEQAWRERDEAVGVVNYWKAQTQDERSRRKLVTAERDALAAELASYKRNAAYIASCVESDGKYIP